MGATYYSLEDDGAGWLFDTFAYTAYRLETLQVYRADYEDADYQRFLAGKPPGGFREHDSYVEEVTRGTAQGRRYHRVHVVTEPLTDYMRFECTGYRETVAAGDDVRILAVREGTWPEGIPHRDYWLFDSLRLLEMNYDQDGKFVSAELIEDPEEVVRANHLRDRALHLSIPYAEYVADFDEFMRRR